MRKKLKAYKLDFNKLTLQMRSFLIVLPILASSLLFLYLIAQYLGFAPNDLAFITRSSKIYDTNDTFLYEISKDNAVKNTPISFEEIPRDCIDAIVSIEDKTFWKNIGVDINGIGRLGLSLIAGGSNSGGSTITQQVIKNAYQKIYNRSPVDKINEIIYAIKLNQYFSKEQIMMMYLNNVYFGNLNYGIQSASEDYFGKKAIDLNLAQCSYLVGIPQWPGIYNPYGQIDKGKVRQKEVLTAMLNNGYITQSEMDGALTFELPFNFKGFEVRAPHYIQYLQDKYGIMNGSSNPAIIKNVDFNSPHKIYTYYNYNLHKYILDLAKTEVTKNKDKNINNAAVVVLDSNSQLLTMVGSVDFFDDNINGKFNSALGYRQPGTSLIPLIHLSAYDNGFDTLKLNKNSPYQVNVLLDDKNQLVDVKNFDGSQSMYITLEDALKNNLAIPAVEATQELGLPKFTDTLTSLNIQRPKDSKIWCNEVSVLEGCEVNLLDLTQAYNVIKHRGVYNNVNEIREIVDDTSIIYINDQSQPKSVNSKLIAAITKVESILDTTKNQKSWVIIKGDTINNKDTFVIAYNDQYTIGIWAGNTKGEEMNGITSDTVAIPILENIIKYLNLTL